MFIVITYGVVLSDLITGRKPVDMKRPPGQGILFSWVSDIHHFSMLFLFEMVHPALQGQFSTKGLVQAGCSNCSHVCSTGSRLSPFHEGCGAVSQPPCQAVF
ncbi:hypothetical protein SUGI_0219000 [Cryptomeria japonica]|nr:hypothetical protein SUGI_0219000 [Cryptomeria japonica]